MSKINNDLISDDESEYSYESDDSFISNNDDIIDIMSKKRKHNDFLINNSVNKKKRTESMDLNIKLFDEISNLNEKKENTLFNYIKSIKDNEKNKYIAKIKKLENINNLNIPYPIQILNWDTTENNKTNAFKMYSELQETSDDKIKLKTAFKKLMEVPFGKNIIPVVNKSSYIEINKYLNNVKISLDKNIYGHEQSKTQLLELVAQIISNPNEGGNIFCLVGSPGIGKTDLIKNSVSKSLGRPFQLISLGGATDGSILNGHSYTYVGSKCGKIIDAVIQSKCMNPILFFDELDKVSKTDKGDEINNILIHLTDQVQNCSFHDNYFSGFEFDLSKAIIIFSLNDLSNISPILLDRIKIITVNGYDLKDKLEIIKKFAMPKLNKEFNLENIKINIEDNVIQYLIENYTNEKGIRKIKEIFKDIYSKINYKRYTEKLKSINITIDFLNINILKNKRKIEYSLLSFNNEIAKIHGMWASEHIMIGGVLPITCCFYPCNNFFNVEYSGLLGDTMKESIKLAKTVAWNLLSTELKEKYNTLWDKNPQGIHITFSCLSEIDGPSATTAIAICIYSLLSNIKIDNTYSITGEMDMIGNVKKIGGLKEKILGARKEGITHILCPYENKSDFDKLDKSLFDGITIEMVKNVKDVIDKILIK